MGDTVEGLPVLERLLLHLHHVDPAGRGSSPEHQTQVGISTAIGIQRKHVPRALRRLVEEGWIALELKRAGWTVEHAPFALLDVDGNQHVLTIVAPKEIGAAMRNSLSNQMMALLKGKLAQRFEPAIAEMSDPYRFIGPSSSANPPRRHHLMPRWSGQLPRLPFRPENG